MEKQKVNQKAWPSPRAYKEPIVERAETGIKFVLKKEPTIVQQYVGKAARHVEVIAEHGLHMGPITSIVQKINKCKSKFKIEKDGIEVDGRSIISILTLGATNGSMIKITANGESATAELEALIKALEEEKITRRISLDPRKFVLIDEKLKLLDDLINSEKAKFLHLLARDLEEKFLYGITISEDEFEVLATELNRLSNIKGLRNDILRELGRAPIEPEISIKVSKTNKGVTFNLQDKNGTNVTFEAKNISNDKLKKFHHSRIVEPLEDFLNDVISASDQRHRSHIVEYANDKLGSYRRALKEFLEAPNNIPKALEKALRTRMKYEHNEFIDVAEV